MTSFPRSLLPKILAMLFVGAMPNASSLADAAVPQDNLARIWDALPSVPTRTRLLLTLNDGSQVRGRVVEARGDAVVLNENEVLKGRLKSAAGTPLRDPLTFMRADVSGVKVLDNVQTVATSFEQLRTLVKNGDFVTVTDPTGNEIQGKIANLSASSLAVLVSGTRRDLLESEVRAIRQRRSDSLANGAAWGGVVGAAIGFGIVLAATAGLCSGCHQAPAWFPLAFAGLWGGVGAGVGLDALVRGEHAIYSKRATLTPIVRVAPLLGRERQGALVSLGF